MGQPKKRTSHRRSRTGRSHLVLKLARKVNAKSPVKARTTLRETGRVKKAAPKQAKPATKAPAAKKPAAKKTTKTA